MLAGPSRSQDQGAAALGAASGALEALPQVSRMRQARGPGLRQHHLPDRRDYPSHLRLIEEHLGLAFDVGCIAAGQDIGWHRCPEAAITPEHHYRMHHARVDTNELR